MNDFKMKKSEEASVRISYQMDRGLTVSQQFKKKESFAFHLAIFLFMCVMSVVGCNKNSTVDATPAYNPGTSNPVASCPSGYYDAYGNCAVTGNGSSSQTNTDAASATLTIANFTDFNTYVATRPLNNPTDVKILVQLQHVGNLRYGGKVAVSYLDNNTRYQGWLESGLGSNASYDVGSRDNGKLEAEYNYWFNYQGKTVYNGFFQDSIGAVVLVIDGTQNQGDGQGGGLVSGSLWYRNYVQSLSPQSYLRKCWFIYLGPYDCRSGTVIQKSSPYPSDGYKLLGTFTGLDMNKAFGL